MPEAASASFIGTVVAVGIYRVGWEGEPPSDAPPEEYVGAILVRRDGSPPERTPENWAVNNLFKRGDLCAGDRVRVSGIMPFSNSANVERIEVQ